LHPALVVPRCEFRQVYGRRWFVAFLPIPVKKEPFRPLPFCARNLRCVTVAEIGLGLWRALGKSERRLTFGGEF
jgi:hypothetical protein